MAKRRVMGIGLAVARIAGWFVIVLAILSIPQLRIFSGRFAEKVGDISSGVLLIAGVVWLVLIEIFLRFFDEFLARN